MYVGGNAPSEEGMNKYYPCVLSLLSWPWLDKYAGGEDNDCRFGMLLITSTDGVCQTLPPHPLMEGYMTISVILADRETKINFKT